MIVRDQHPLSHGQSPAQRSGRLGSGWLRLIFLLVMTLLAIPAAADDRLPLVLSGPADIETVGRHFEYVLDPDWNLTPQDFIGPAAMAMQPLPAAVPDFGYTASRAWLRLDLVNGTTGTADWRFFAQANFTQQIAIYRVAADGTIATILDLTTASPFRARPIDYPQMVAPFALAPGEAATLLVSYYSQGSSRISMSIETPDSFAAQARLQGAKSYAFYGMMLVMVALATAALVALRRAVLAAYVGYISSVLLYIAHADGVAFQLLWPNLPEFNSMASIVAGSGVMVFAGLFAITFLETRRYNPLVHRILIAVIVSVVVLDAVLWATAPQLLKQLLVVMISICTLTYICAAVIAARTRFRAVRFYLFAWLVSLVPAVLFTARFALGLESNVFTAYDMVRLALVFDALMMGLAVFDNYNQQRHAALTETLAHAHRNLALGERLAVLEERYEQVKSAARQREESVKDTVHDLRQPMQALRLSLRQMFLPRAETAPDIGQVETALTYMEQLVADRLAEDRHPTASPATSASEPALHAVLTGVADMFAAEATAKGLGLQLKLAAPDTAVPAYPLMRIVANLTSNAIKYTATGRVVIALRREGPGHRVEVHDTGPGLSGVAFERALLRNERLERDSATAEGSGLGLSVVKEIVETQGWRISSCAARQTGASIRIHIPG